MKNKIKNKIHGLSQTTCIYIYSALIVSIAMFAIVNSVAFYTYFTNVAFKLHNKMFMAVTKAKFKFFCQNSCGAILNRFSLDTGSLDSNLPKYLADTVEVSMWNS